MNNPKFTNVHANFVEPKLTMREAVIRTLQMSLKPSEDEPIPSVPE